MSSKREELRVDTDAIRERIDLVDYLERELGVPAKKHSGYYTFSACPKCGASRDPKSTRISVRDGHYRCFSCPDSGDVIHAHELLYGMSFLDAAKELAGPQISSRKVERPRIDRSAEVAEAHAKAARMREVFSKLQAACQSMHNELVVLNYLFGSGKNERCIPMDVIREAQARGMVGFMPHKPADAKAFLIESVGEDLLKASGLWKPDKKFPGIAYRPLVFFLPGMSSAEFRMIGEVKPGQQKSMRYGPLEYPYWWKGTDSQVMIVEGMIDLMSAVAMGWKGHLLGLPGCNSVRAQWFEAASKRYRIRRWVIALDNDADKETGRNPGQEWSARISEMLNELKLANYIHTPPSGDLNDILKARAHPQTFKNAA